MLQPFSCRVVFSVLPQIAHGSGLTDLFGQLTFLLQERFVLGLEFGKTVFGKVRFTHAG